jgi:hypothetical protein
VIIPGQQFTVLDPGLPAAVPGITASLALGTSSAGDYNKVYSFTNPKDVVDTLGQGELPELLCHALAVAGGPQYGVRVSGGVPGTVSAVTKVGTGDGTVAVGGLPYDGYSLKVLITKGGALGTAEFSFSLDGVTYSDVLVIPSSGTFANIAGVTGLTLTFASTFVAGDTYSFACTAPFYTPTNLADGIAGVLSSDVDFAFMIAAGESVAASSGKLLAAALDLHAVSLFNQARFVRAMLAAGKSDKATTITEYAGINSPNVLATYGRCQMVSSKPLAGWGIIDRSIVNPVAARAASSLISTDLGRVASGALPGVVSISHDEARSPMMDAKRFTTLRTVQGRGGYYITNGRLFSSPGSDFRYWQHGRCMDTACRVAWVAQSSFIGASVRTVGAGTLDPRDAARWEGPVRTSLDDALLSPESAEGTSGHVSACAYALDRANNVLASDSVKSTVGIKPRGYAKFIYTQLSYTINAGA